MRNDVDRALFKNPGYPPGCNSRELAELDRPEYGSERYRTELRQSCIEDDDSVEHREGAVESIDDQVDEIATISSTPSAPEEHD